MRREADIGVVGLAVMGENLILNMESRGFTVACFNRTTSKVDDFINGHAAGKNIIGCHSAKGLIDKLKRPRKVMCMIKAGRPVDAFIESVTPYLEAGDIIIDGGNSYFPDTIRRVAAAEQKGLLYVGAGVSGGEEGALLGPSIMPGGSPAAWEAIRPIFQKICAHTQAGEPCCDWVGESGAGHFVKMVHNGIEYGDMQLIGETYQMMKVGLGLSNEQMHGVFAQWNKGLLDSYLIEITRDILGHKIRSWTHTAPVPGRRSWPPDYRKRLPAVRRAPAQPLSAHP
jgi:6-phosphogluconate dehydrogenase